MLDVDHLGVRADPLVDVAPVPHRDDAPVGHGDRLGGGAGVVDGQHGSE